MRRFTVGQRVYKDMGLRESGVVCHPVHSSKCTDGTYRAPYRHERAVFVAWDNGTVGWTHAAFLTAHNAQECAK